VTSWGRNAVFFSLFYSELDLLTLSSLVVNQSVINQLVINLLPIHWSSTDRLSAAASSFSSWVSLPVFVPSRSFDLDAYPGFGYGRIWL
jgi:hypothetical protein